MLAWNTSSLWQVTVAFLIILLCGVQVASVAAQDANGPDAAVESDKRAEVEDVHLRLKSQVTIYRDEWGTPHVHGATDEAAIFGMGYVQSEDYFWQVEDNCIRALGRYSEIAGEKSLRADTLNRLFEVPRRSEDDYKRLSKRHQKLLAAFTHGINYFLATHPDVKSRLVHRFEPYYVLAMDRYLLLDFVYGKAHAGRPDPQSFESAVQEATGSNQWAVGPSRTKTGSTMLLINPHQPWYGSGQFYEAHLISDEGTNFSGGCFYGNPIPTLGFNKYLGWAYTVNEPDVADIFRVKFAGKPTEGALEYQFGNETRTAESWDDVILVKKGKSLVENKFTFYKTHHGPIVRFENDTTGMAVRIAALFDLGRVDQAHEMIHATNFEQWYDAMRHCGIPMFNVAYADRDGNIFYAYNGAIPIRDSRFNWRKPVDGNDPATQWKGIYAFDDLPQVFNPPSGYVQNCNTSPFLTTDEGNPNRGDFPAYMFEDRDEDKRRAKMSRRLLRTANRLTFDDFRRLSLDTTLYWPLQELPRFRQDFARLNKENPPLANKVRPYLEHLWDWDCQVTMTSTQATLCEAWYIELYGEGYPAETIRNQYESSRMSRLNGLVKAARGLKQIHGDWKVPWGEVHRVQRVTKKEGVVEAAVSFNGNRPSVFSPGAPGPLGVIFTTYSTPTVRWIRPVRYAVVGASYLGVVEFGKEAVRAGSLVPYGQSSNRKSPHYMDQAQLMAEKRLKKAWLTLEDVKKHCEKQYRPGEI